MNNKVKEIFGIYCGNKIDLNSALKKQTCPFSHKRCYKTRKSNPDVAIGTCTVRYQKNDVVICPNRLLENNQIFIDCLHLLTIHEPGNELYILPEISIPGGSVDYFLSSAKDGKIKDFIGIELQTLDTTGTVWPERQRLLKQYGFTVDEKDVQNARPFGMNWKMTAKTILVQMRHKAQTFEKLNKHLVLIIQTPLFDYFKREFAFSNITGSRIGDPIHIHAYDLKEKDNRLKLSLNARISTDSSGIAECLGLKAKTNVELRDLIRKLEKKLNDKYRLSIV